MIHFTTDKSVDLDLIIDLYEESFIEIKRPTSSKDEMKSLFEHANLVVCAWDNSKLIGICRGFTDFSFVTYIADLAVTEKYRNKGIGKSLLDYAFNYSEKSKRLVLLSNESANSYYKKLGFEKHNRAWILTRD
tara:strand:+ start:1006 stop:1404 length:399 start_codon:yes stop_codon:yes gene_type:complete